MTYIIAAIAAAALVWLLELLFVQVRLLFCRIRLNALLRRREAFLEEKMRSTPPMKPPAPTGFGTAMTPPNASTGSWPSCQRGRGWNKGGGDVACKFNGHLRCEDTDRKRLNGCQHCGWNPEVVQKRKAHKKAVPDGANIEDGRPEGQQSSTPSV